MGTCYKLIAVDVKRTLDLDKFYNRRSAYEALDEIVTWGARGREVTPEVLRRAAAKAALAQPTTDEDADDIAYGAEKLLKSAIWMERVGAPLAYLVSDTSGWEEDVFPLSAAEERRMTPEAVWEHQRGHHDWPEDDPHNERLDIPKQP